MFSTILIIDKRKELSTKYKKSLENNENIVLNARTLKDAILNIQKQEPDLIIVSDSIEEELAPFCEKIRALTYNTRPVIIALSKSADYNDRIKVLNSGADDFISEPVNIEEFKTRINAHLRRDLESNLDNATLLPNKKYVLKALNRMLNLDTKPAVLLLGIENLASYKSIYSDLAGEKILQTYTAIIKSTIEENDFLGQIDENNFLLLTNPYSAEKIATFLTFAFDTVCPKFYSTADAQRGYMLLKGDRKAGMRVNLVSTLIAGIVDNYEMINSVDILLERLYSLKKIAKIPSGSNYIIDRIKLSGNDSVEAQPINNSIFIKEKDEALALLIRATLELQGYNIVDSIDYSASVQPNILILDSNDDLSGLAFCKELKNNNNFVNSKIIVTTSVHDKTTVLNSGADLYLPKPYEISDLLRWIEFLI